MSIQSATQLQGLRVWRDERLGQLWRIAYNEGDGETIVAFPDTAALGDFIMERLGLELSDDLKELPPAYYTYILDSDGNTDSADDTDDTFLLA